MVLTLEVINLGMRKPHIQGEQAGLRELRDSDKCVMLHHNGKRKIPDPLLLSLAPHVHERKEGENTCHQLLFSH